MFSNSTEFCSGRESSNCVPLDFSLRDFQRLKRVLFAFNFSCFSFTIFISVYQGIEFVDLPQLIDSPVVTLNI